MCLGLQLLFFICFRTFLFVVVCINRCLHYKRIGLSAFFNIVETLLYCLQITHKYLVIHDSRNITALSESSLSNQSQFFKSVIQWLYNHIEAFLFVAICINRCLLEFRQGKNKINVAENWQILYFFFDSWSSPNISH
jgi:hypothetical protein